MGPPAKKGVVRLQIHEGSWTLQPAAGGTHATYRVRIDLAGSLPAWMARGRTAQDIPRLFTSVREQLPYYR